MTALAQNTQLQQQDSVKKNIEILFKNNLKQIQSVLPKILTPQRLLRIAISEISKNDKILKCSTQSILLSVLQCAQFGFEPGDALGKGYLIPYYNGKKQQHECKFMIGYRGMIDLARRSGEILSISSQVVKENDFFEFEYGIDDKLRHIPAQGDRGQILYFYAVAKLKDGGHQFEVMTKEQIDQIRSTVKTNNVWEDYYEEMGRKTAIRRLFKYLPMSIEMAQAVVMDEKQEAGESGNFIEGELQIMENKASREDELLTKMQKTNTKTPVASQQSTSQQAPKQPANKAEMINTQTGEVIPAEKDDLDKSWENF